MPPARGCSPGMCLRGDWYHLLTGVAAFTYGIFLIQVGRRTGQYLRDNISQRIEAGRLDLREEQLALRPLLGEVEIVGNALKFTQQGRINISAGVEWLDSGECMLRFVVADTGIGIRKEDQALLFQSFSQIDSSVTRAYGGAGLGLRISSELVALMGGQIGLESEPGKSSKFWFTIRMRIGTAAAFAAGEVASSGGAIVDLAGTCVLLVEDNPVNQVVAQAMLQSLGCSVEIAGNGRDALERVAAGQFDLVLMDCQMPVMDGFQATRDLRAREAAGSARLTVIAMTASALEGDRELCLAAGMDDYLAKPFLREQLVAILSRWRSQPVATAADGSGPDRTPVAENAKASADGSEVIDPSAIEFLRQMETTQPGILQSILRKYLDSAQQFVKTIAEANAADLKEVERAAHSLKSSSARLGAHRLAKLASEIEMASRAGAMEQVLDHARKIEAEFEPIAAAVRRLLV